MKIKTSLKNLETRHNLFVCIYYTSPNGDVYTDPKTPFFTKTHYNILVFFEYFRDLVYSWTKNVLIQCFSIINATICWMKFVIGLHTIALKVFSHNLQLETFAPAELTLIFTDYDLQRKQKTKPTIFQPIPMDDLLFLSLIQKKRRRNYDDLCQATTKMFLDTLPCLYLRANW